MEVMDTPFRAGDLNHGYQAVADNLPNDARIHQEKGTKKIFFKNFMDARVNVVILPIAKRLMRADQAAQASGEGYLAQHAAARNLRTGSVRPSRARTASRWTFARPSVRPSMAWKKPRPTWSACSA